MKTLGDIAVGGQVSFLFNTATSTGAPITLAGTPTVRVYRNNNTVEDDSGVTLTVDQDSVTGMHLVQVDTSADAVFYTAGADYNVVLTAGTVDGVSVAGTVLAHFSIENRSVENLPTLTEVEASTVLAKEATVDALPLLTEIEASTVLAKEATVDALPTLGEMEASSLLTKAGGFKKNTAVAAFPFTMVTSAGTPLAGVTVTATRSLDGAAFASCANAVTAISNGAYKIDLAAADLNADTVILRFTATGAKDRFFTIKTVA